MAAAKQKVGGSTLYTVCLLDIFIQARVMTPSCPNVDSLPFVMAYMVPLFTVVGPPATEDIITTEDRPAAFNRG